MNIFSIEHEIIYRSAFKIFADNPVLGIGPKTYREECKKEEYQVYMEGYGVMDACQLHPHNTYIQLLSETGIVGSIPVIIVLMLIIYFFGKSLIDYYFKKQKKYDDYYTCLLICVFINLFPLIPTGNFFNNWLSIIYYLPIGLILKNIYSKKSYENI